MITSARNTLNGTIASIVPGAVHTEIALQFKTQQVIAVITNASAQRLDVKIGDEAYALIKSSSIILSKTFPERISARNVLKVSVADIIKGAVNSEVKMTLDDTTLTSIITNESVEELKLNKDDTVYAIFKASGVILGIK